MCVFQPTTYTGDDIWLLRQRCEDTFTQIRGATSDLLRLGNGFVGRLQRFCTEDSFSWLFVCMLRLSPSALGPRRTLYDAFANGPSTQNACVVAHDRTQTEGKRGSSSLLIRSYPRRRLVSSCCTGLSIITPGRSPPAAVIQTWMWVEA